MAINSSQGDTTAYKKPTPTNYWTVFNSSSYQAQLKEAKKIDPKAGQLIDGSGNQLITTKDPTYAMKLRDAGFNVRETKTNQAGDVIGLTTTTWQSTPTFSSTQSVTKQPINENEIMSKPSNDFLLARSKGYADVTAMRKSENLAFTFANDQRANVLVNVARPATGYETFGYIGQKYLNKPNALGVFSPMLGVSEFFADLIQEPKRKALGQELREKVVLPATQDVATNYIQSGATTNPFDQKSMNYIAKTSVTNLFGGMALSHGVGAVAGATANVYASTFPKATQFLAKGVASQSGKMPYIIGGLVGADVISRKLAGQEDWQVTAGLGQDVMQGAFIGAGFASGFNYNIKANVKSLTPDTRVWTDIEHGKTTVMSKDIILSKERGVITAQGGGSTSGYFKSKVTGVSTTFYNENFLGDQPLIGANTKGISWTNVEGVRNPFTLLEKATIKGNIPFKSYGITNEIIGETKYLGNDMYRIGGFVQGLGGKPTGVFWSVETPFVKIPKTTPLFDFESGKLYSNLGVNVRYGASTFVSPNKMSFGTYYRDLQIKLPDVGGAGGGKPIEILGSGLGVDLPRPPKINAINFETINVLPASQSNQVTSSLFSFAETGTAQKGISQVLTGINTDVVVSKSLQGALKAQETAMRKAVTIGAFGITAGKTKTLARTFTPFDTAIKSDYAIMPVMKNEQVTIPSVITITEPVIIPVTEQKLVPITKIIPVTEIVPVVSIPPFSPFPIITPPFLPFGFTDIGLDLPKGFKFSTTSKQGKRYTPSVAGVFFNKKSVKIPKFAEFSGLDIRPMIIKRKASRRRKKRSNRRVY